MSSGWASRPGTDRKTDDESVPDTGSRDLPLPENVTWHRVNVVTPLLEGWKIVTGILAFVTVQNLDDFVRAYRIARKHGFSLWGQSGYYLTGLIGVILLWTVFGMLSWWRRSYAVDADGVYLRSGILSRKLRTARLPRIQSVDVVHPLLGRIFGLGQLTVEVAGGRGSRIVIGYLTTRELHALHDRILDLAAGRVELPGTGEGESEAGERAQERPPGAPEPGRPATSQRPAHLWASNYQEHPLYGVEVGVLIGALLRSITTYLILLLIISQIVAATLAVTLGAMPSGGAVTIVSSFITTFVGVVGLVWSRFNNAWNFQAAATPSGIRMRYGLTADTSRTLPPGRVHGVGLTQPILWRGKDWWKVEVTVAGREDRPQDGQNRQTGNMLLPVGARDTALRALWLVVPDLGAPDPDALLSQVLTGWDDDGVGDPQAPAGSAARGFVRISRRGRVFRPLTWRRAAVILTDTCVIIRHGRWRRRAAVFPYERIQSLALKQGPLARRRALASLYLDMVAHEVPARITNLDAADAKELAAQISRRALRRSSAEQLDRWLARAVAATQIAEPPSVSVPVAPESGSRADEGPARR